MSLRTPDLLFTAIAPAIWGSTYIVTTQYLPNFSPMTVAMLRALPAGLLLVMIVRQIPTGIWWMRIFILGALNISLFWSLLFISVYRLPGGVAATVGAVQPLMVVFISAALLGSPIRLMAVTGGYLRNCGRGAVGVDTKRSARSCRRRSGPGGGGFHGVRNRADPQVATSRASAHLYRLATGGRRTSARSSSFSV